MREGLAVGEDERAPGVSAEQEPEPQSKSMRQKGRDSFQKLRGSASFYDDLVRVEKQAGLREHVGVEMAVAHGGDDGALDGREDLVEGGDGEPAEPEGVTAQEAELEAFLEAFEAGYRHILAAGRWCRFVKTRYGRTSK